MIEVKNINKILVAGIIVVAGLLLFKFIPMEIWGNDILFDASAHIAITMFILYIVWFFIDQNEKWRIPYFILSALVLTIIAINRILVDAHNYIGLLGGLLVGLLAIGIAEWNDIDDKIKF